MVGPHTHTLPTPLLPNKAVVVVAAGLQSPGLARGVFHRPAGVWAVSESLGVWVGSPHFSEGPGREVKVSNPMTGGRGAVRPLLESVCVPGEWRLLWVESVGSWAWRVYIAGGAWLCFGGQ